MRTACLRQDEYLKDSVAIVDLLLRRMMSDFARFISTSFIREISNLNLPLFTGMYSRPRDQLRGRRTRMLILVCRRPQFGRFQLWH